MHLTGGQQPTGAAQVDLVGAGGLPPSIGPPLDVAAGMAHGHRTSDFGHRTWGFGRGMLTAIEMLCGLLSAAC